MGVGKFVGIRLMAVERVENGVNIERYHLFCGFWDFISINKYIQ